MADGSQQIRTFSSEGDLQRSVCSLIAEKSKEAIADHGFFSVAFSGGSSAKIICKGLTQSENINFSKWRILFCDERYVQLTNPDSNYSIVKEELLDKISSTPEDVLALNASLPLDEAAKEYETKLRGLYPLEKGVPQLDMLLLGMGPDGHICSLFPGHPLLKESIRLVAPISDSPKPPPCRITLTYPVIHAARGAIFVATGASKAEVVKRVLEGNEENPLPAAKVKLTNGKVYWFLDEGSSSLVKK